MPATLNEPPHRWTSYQHETASKGTCGSLATIGRPLALRRPETTQLLLPPPCGSPAAVPTPSPQPSPPSGGEGRVRGPRGYDRDGRMLSESDSTSRNARYNGPSPSA